MRKNKTHFKKFAYLAIPFLGLVIVLGIVAAGFDGGNGLPVKSQAISGGAVVSEGALSWIAPATSGGAVGSSSPVMSGSAFMDDNFYYVEQDQEPYEALVEIIQEENRSDLQVYPIHCLINPADGSYYFTHSFAEVAGLTYEGWIYDGVAYYAN